MAAGPCLFSAKGLVVDGGGHQLGDVLQPAGGVQGVLGLELGHVPGSAGHGVDEKGGAGPGVGLGPEVVEQE